MRKQVPYLLAFLLGCLITLCVYIYFNSPPVHAAPIAPVPEYCVLTSTIGAITTFFCEPDIGPDYLTNNVGWIEKVD